MKKVIVVGSLIVDIATFLPRFPVNGETVLGRTVRFGPGGKGSNQACAAHRAGGEVIMIAKMGKDFLSSILREHYEREGMTRQYLFESDTSETGSAIIEVNEQTGENKIIVVKGANDELTAAEVLQAEREFSDCDIVLTQLESSLDSVLETKRLAQKYHKPIILNPAPLQEVPAGLFEGIDYITPNETEAAYFVQMPVTNIEEARLSANRLLTFGVKNVVITLGKNGAFFKNNTEEFHVDITPNKPVDTTGAGDAFNGGFAVAIAEGLSSKQAVQFASCTAGISVTRKGTSTSMPMRSEIDALYQSFYKK